MLKQILNRILKKYGRWRLTQAALVASAACLLAAITLTLALPVRLGAGRIDLATTVNPTPEPDISAIMKPDVPEFREVAKLMRMGLFKPEIMSRRVDGFDNTLKTIMSQLKLKAVIKIKGVPTAYIDVRGKGVIRCTVGMSAPNLFTVLGINNDNKSVELEVIGHRQTLTK